MVEWLNTFNPEFLVRRLLSLNLDRSIVANRIFNLKSKSNLANCVDPDEMVVSVDGSSTLFAKVSVLLFRVDKVK